MVKLYNTLGRKIQEFKPIKKGQVGLYACGPTVYWFAHIGNFRTYLFLDLLRRALALNGFKTKLIMNITDVGHLTDDADAGEDKMLVAMRREGKSAYAIADFYTRAFLADAQKLNIKPASKYVKATAHIKEQIATIKKLEQNGFTYQTADGIYFDTAKLPDYGRLGGQAAGQKLAGARVEMGEKRNPTDFALWKFSPKDAKREMEWPSPWGKGFPGWHIECSAMAAKYLGVPFDIHVGGVDHIAVHHENEIAQTQGAEGKLLANYWLHGEFLTVNGGKMSKSLGNLYLVDDLVKKGFDPLAFRYFALGAHYRTLLNFTWEGMQAAANALQRLRDTARTWPKPKGGCAAFEKRFLAALNDDLNLPEALAVVWQMVEAKEPEAAKAASLLKFDQVLGLDLKRFVGQRIKTPKAVAALLKKRGQARIDKDWKTADKIREEIERLGYSVKDTAQGQQILPR